MNINLSLFKKKKNTIPTHLSWNPIHPRRDWHLLLGVSTIIFLAIVAWSAYLFVTIQATEKLQTEAQPTQQDEVGNKLKTIEAHFEKRS